jgi:hypothetical protein
MTLIAEAGGDEHSQNPALGRWAVCVFGASPAYAGVNGGNFATSSPTFDTSRNEIW